MDLPTLQSIELPCFCDTSTAMRLMGSQALVHSCVAQRSPELLLQLRPADPLAHPVVGRPQSSPALLVRVRRRRGGGEEGQVEILGKIETAYRFRALADFQFLPSTTAAKGDAIVDTTQEVLETPPAIFLRNAPPPNIFKPQKAAQQKVKPERKVVVVKFGHAIPTEPPVDTTRRRKMQKFESTQQGLNLLFSSRPLWQRRLLNSYPVFARQLNMMNECLPYAAFTFSSGPWAVTWCRFGYNPTRHRDACIYQIMQVRMKRRMLEELCEAIQEAVHAAVTARGVPALDTEIGYRAIEADLDSNRVLLTPNSAAGQDELLSGTVKLTLFGCEVKQQVNYQLCDVDDDDMLQYLSGVELLPRCDMKTGWFHDSTIDGVRKRILQLLQRRVKKLVHAVSQAPSESIVVRTASAAKTEEQSPEDWLAKYTSLAQRYASTVAGGGLDPAGGSEETAVEALPVIESDHEQPHEEGLEAEEEAEEGAAAAAGGGGRAGKKPKKPAVKSKAAAVAAGKRAAKRARTTPMKPPPRPPRAQPHRQPPSRLPQEEAAEEEGAQAAASISLPGLEPMPMPGLSIASAVEGARPFEIFDQAGSESEFYPESEEDMSGSGSED